MFCISKVPTTVRDLVYRLTCHEEINEQTLERELTLVAANTEAFAAVREFSTDRYKRNLLYDSAELQVLLLCWKAGQGSPVHDHGVSFCGVRVIEGIATETVYPSSEGTILQRDLGAGDVVAYPGSFVHKIENKQPDPLVTLHVYAPRLIS